MRFVGRMVFFVLLPVLALVGLASYLAVYFSGTSESAYERVAHTYVVIGVATGILADIDAAESGVRGFVITQSQDYLGPFEGAASRIPRRLAELGKLVSDNPPQAETVAMLQPLVAEKLELLRSARDRVLTGDRSSLLDAPSVGLGPGKLAMDRIRAIVDDFVDVERQLLSARQAESQQADRLMLYAALGGSFVGLAALLVGILLLAVNNWRLQRTEDRLKRQSEILQLTLDNIRHGIAYFDGRGRLAAFNGRFFSKLQFPSELSELGAPLSAFRAVEQSRGTSILEPAVSRSSAVPLDVRLDGSEFEVYRTTTADGGFVVSSVDVTQRARAEAMFRQIQKMESIGQLTGGVAHDFNNLLQIVASNIDLVRASPDDPRNPQRLDLAMAGAERGARLTRQLLAFARRQPLEPRPTNLGRLVGDMTEMIRRSLGEAIEVETVTAGGLWSAMADPGQMENAILNLAINARDAMPDGGQLTIEVANASLDETYAADHSEVMPGQYVMLAVSDTGMGMTPEVVARAFEPFFSTKPDGQGTGLGLSQVYGYAKQLGGHVKIYSEPGHGTTVKMYLPRTRQPEELLEVQALSAIEFGRETVLVVEDDAAVRGGAVDMLADLGYRALQAADAEAALAVLMSGTSVDVLFTDVVMPGPLKTRDLVRQAQALQPGIAVLFTSGYTENAIIHNGRLDSGVLLISKPYRREELARKLRVAIAQARASTPQAPTVAPPPPPTIPPNETSPVTVLFVEDDALVRLSAVDYLQHVGYAVIEAGNAEQALEAVRSRPEISILLTDLGLPGMGGAELIDAARRLRPSLAVAVLTGRSRTTVDDDGVLPAGVLCLEKPYELEALRRTIETLAAKLR